MGGGFCCSSSDNQWAERSSSAGPQSNLVRQNGPIRHNAAVSRRLESKRIWNGYLHGQLFSVGKAALWWSTIGLLCMSIVQSELALGGMRLSFNLALLVASPLAVQGAELLPMNQLLTNTTILRLLTWALCAAPLVVITSSTIALPHYLLWILLLIIMFADGVGAAYANSVDIDCGGLDILATEYDLPLTDFMRYKYTNTHQIVFDSSFLLFVTPIILTVDYLVCEYSGPIRKAIPPFILQNRTEDLVFGLSCILLFTILSVCSWYCYSHYLPCRCRPDFEEEEIIPWSQTYATKMREMFDGLIIVLHNKALKWRLAFLAAETALEDSMVSLIIPLISFYIGPSLFGRESILLVGGISCSAIGVGKLGGLLASRLITEDYYSLGPEQSDLTEPMLNESLEGCPRRLSSSRLFDSVVLSAFSLILLPIGFAMTCPLGFNFGLTNWDGLTTGAAPKIGALCCLMSIFLFFTFSAGPKIGFSNLIQDALNFDDYATPAVFGFVGVLVTITDGILIFILNVLFYYSKKIQLTHYLLVLLSIIYLILALLEKKYGPKLIANQQPSR